LGCDGFGGDPLKQRVEPLAERVAALEGGDEGWLANILRSAPSAARPMASSKIGVPKNR
jgi:hypothetical protein